MSRIVEVSKSAKEYNCVEQLSVLLANQIMSFLYLVMHILMFQLTFLMDFGNNRNTILLAFILLMLAGVALLEASALVVLILLGLLFMVRQFDNNQLSDNADSYDYSSGYDDYGSDYNDSSDYEVRSTSQAQADPVYRHALESVQRAGHNPDDVQVLTVDIGVMAFKDNGEPTVFRTWSLPDDVDYIQPFVQLRLPSKATGRIKFEVIDAAGNTVISSGSSSRMKAIIAIPIKPRTNHI